MSSMVTLGTHMINIVCNNTFNDYKDSGKRCSYVYMSAGVHEINQTYFHMLSNQFTPPYQ